MCILGYVLFVGDVLGYVDVLMGEGIWIGLV